MNSRYFACLDCHLYVDAGYRWAYFVLEKDEYVQLNEKIDVEKIEKLKIYWNPPLEEQNDWLCEKVLPAVKQFLGEHKEHKIIYLEEDTLFREESLLYSWQEFEMK